MPDTKFSALTDGITAIGTDRWGVARSPFGATDNRYVTPAYVSTYIETLAHTWLATQTITPAVNTSGLVISGFSLTGANAQSLLSLAGTWNTTGAPAGILLNITDTASDAASQLMDLKVGGNRILGVRRAFIGAKFDRTTFDLTEFSYFNRAAANGFIGFGTSESAVTVTLSDSKVEIASGGSLAWSNDASNVPAGTSDLFLRRDAANTRAWRNGTASQTGLNYDTWSSGTDFHRLATRTARATLSGVTGASVTATNLIPDGAIVMGVTTKVTTGLGVTSGTTGYTVGDGTDVDRWGAIVGTAAGTSSDNRDWTATTVQAFIAANNVVITASGGNFDGTGVIYVSVQYLIGEVD